MRKQCNGGEKSAQKLNVISLNHQEQFCSLILFNLNTAELTHHFSTLDQIIDLSKISIVVDYGYKCAYNRETEQLAN